MPRLQVIDASVMRRLQDLARRGEHTFVPRLIDVFLEDSAARLARLHQALGQDDRTILKAVAHGLGGSAGALGLIELAARCLDLEYAPAQLPRADAEKLVRDVDRAFDRAAAALHRVRPPPSP